ncbi:MAG: hormogonium polysaccharide biosynthesis glycosyltransferase HpsE [Microcoleaceae cyanobacterium]
MAKPIDFTVAIPTYNGAERLPKLLDKIRQQNQTEDISWEVIIVDNNSSDKTAEVIKYYQSNWLESVPLKYFFEPKQGATFARQRAVKEAEAKLIGFLDDDNFPTSNWIATAYSFAQKYPQAGAYSGQIHGEFEVEPPENFKKIEQYLSIREHGLTAHLFEPENLRLPTTAALVVRKQAWVESIPISLSLKGRINGSMLGGEDYEILLYLHKAGWEIWYNPAMETYHQIPKWRLEKDYLLKLARGCGLATCQLLMINAQNWQKPLILIRTLLGNLKRIINYYIRYRGELKHDLIANFELEFYWGSFLSVLVYLRNTLWQFQ